MNPSSKPRLLARSAPAGGDCQTYESHVSGVKSIACSIAKRISVRFKDKGVRNTFRKVVELASEYHDVGKVDPANQKALFDNNLSRLPYDHWKDGAYYLLQHSKDASMVALSHHSCLDRGDLFNLAKTPRPQNKEYIRIHREELIQTGKLSSVPSGPVPRLTEGIMMRMALSCVVNGDWDDSARAKHCFVPKTAPVRWAERLQRLEQSVALLSEKKGIEISEKTRSAVKTFQMRRHGLRQRLWNEMGTVGMNHDISVIPATVGLGKTFSFLRLALRKAIKQKAPHIFIVAPYNHIVEQLVKVIRDCLVLEGENPEEIVANHTSTAEYVGNGTKADQWVLQTSASRWKCPVIITSSVQFFETMSSNVSGKLVKLAEVPNSIVVVDEWHSVFEESLTGFYWKEIGNMSKLFNTKFILSSGSMTRFWDQAFKGKYAESVKGLRIKEVVSKRLLQKSVTSEKGRVSYLSIGPQTADTLTDRVLNQEGKGKKTIVLLSTTQNVALMAQSLINHGRNVYTVFGSLIDEDAGRNVNSIRSDDSDWIVICTTSIESGIDISAEVAFSVERSIMSQIQLGGRVNREGNFKQGLVLCFTESREPFNLNQSFIEPANISRPLLTGINNADKSAHDYLQCFHLNPRNKLIAADNGMDFPKIALESRVIKEGRGNALVGPKSKGIYDLLVRKHNGENVKISMKEVYRNSVPMPSLNGGKSIYGFFPKDFKGVAGFETEDGGFSLYWYQGEYDPQYFGIWASPISRI